MRHESDDPAADPVVARAVHRAKLELEQMIDLTPSVMLLVDAEGRVTRANLAFCRLLGAADFGAVLGRRLSEVFAVQEDGFFERLLGKSGGYGIGEAVARVGKGDPCAFRFTLVEAGSGGDARVLIVEDITREREAAEAAEKQHKVAAVRALAGALMHKINQRLAVINMRAKLLLISAGKDALQAEELKKGLGDITDLSMEVAAIIGKLDKQVDFVTETYLEGLEIMDLDRSTGERGGDSADVG
jgi:PAS domain S-box-containing protein